MCWHAVSSVWAGTSRRMTAERLSKCKACTGNIEPGDQIYLFDRWEKKEREAAHQGCLWDNRQGTVPCLTWGQVRRLYDLTRGFPSPSDPLAVRFLGALVAARAAVLALKGSMAITDDRKVALQLGVDLLEGYRQLLRHMPNVDRKDPALVPVQPNGQPWKDQEAEAKQRERLRLAVELGRKVVEHRYQIASGLR